MLKSVSGIDSFDQAPNVLLMFGEEDFLREEAYDQLINKLITPEIAAFDFEVLDGNEISAEDLVERAGAFPMLAERRTVSVRHFDKIVGGRGGKKGDKNNPLTKFLARPPQSLFLILQAAVPSLNGVSAELRNPKQKSKGQKKLTNARFPWNLIIENGEWIEFRKPYDRELPSWIAKRVKSFGAKIEPEACELLLTQTGDSLRALAAEVDKVLTYVGEKRDITRDDIAAITGASKNWNVFELQKAIGRGDAVAALRIMERMVTMARQELMIITMLARYFTILWKLGDAQRLSRDKYQLAGAVGISPFFVPDYLDALNVFPPARVENALRALAEAEMRLKSTPEDPLIVLQNALVRILENRI